MSIFTVTDEKKKNFINTVDFRQLEQSVNLSIQALIEEIP